MVAQQVLGVDQADDDPPRDGDRGGQGHDAGQSTGWRLQAVGTAAISPSRTPSSHSPAQGRAAYPY